MLPSGDIEHKEDISISLLANSIYYFIDTCFIMDLSGTEKGKNRYRILAFHESERKIFIDQYYQTLRGAKIAFGKFFKNLAWSDNVAPIWTNFYVPDRDRIDDMLGVVENSVCN
jgi:hypothetical protein